MRQAGIYSGMFSGGRTGPHLLPLARIKKVMKKSGDNACELFIEDLTRRSWMVTMKGKRRTLHNSAVMATDIFYFLVSLVSDSTNPLDLTTVKRETLEP
ncbi:hypothetical protein ACB098_06G064300 [Castanea mollissima]